MKNDNTRTSIEDFDALWAEVHKARSTTKSVTVDKRLLTNLLMDHSSLHGAAVGDSKFNKSLKMKE